MSRKIKINITLPESTEDITLDMYLKLEQIFNREDINDYDKENRAIKAVTGMRYDLIDRMKQTDREEILFIIQKALSTEGAKFTDRFEIDGIKFGFIPNLDKMLSKEWLDLKNYESDTGKPEKLMAIFFRPIVKDMGNLGYIIEEYKGTEKYHEIMKRSPISAYKGAMVFLEFSKRIANLYPSVFSRSGTSEGIDAVNFFNKWGWYSTLDMLADGDFTKYEKVEMLNIHFMLKFLSHRLEKNRLIENLRKGANVTQL